MNQFLNFLTKLKSFWKLYKHYGYDGENMEGIIDTYKKQLCDQTTKFLQDIIQEISEWRKEQEYKEKEREAALTKRLYRELSEERKRQEKEIQEKMRIWRSDNPETNRIDVSIAYREIETKGDFWNIFYEKVNEIIEKEKKFG